MDLSDNEKDRRILTSNRFDVGSTWSKVAWDDTKKHGTYSRVNAGITWETGKKLREY